jgi:hypothetical protein
LHLISEGQENFRFSSKRFGTLLTQIGGSRFQIQYSICLCKPWCKQSLRVQKITVKLFSNSTFICVSVMHTTSVKSFSKFMENPPSINNLFSTGNIIKKLWSP